MIRLICSTNSGASCFFFVQAIDHPCSAWNVPTRHVNALDNTTIYPKDMQLLSDSVNAILGTLKWTRPKQGTGLLVTTYRSHTYLCYGEEPTRCTMPSAAVSYSGTDHLLLVSPAVKALLSCKMGYNSSLNNALSLIPCHLPIRYSHFIKPHTNSFSHLGL